MIGSVSSASFASYGYSNHPQGDRYASHKAPEENEKSLDELKAAKAKEKEEKEKNPNHLDESEKQQVEKLKQRDTEVRTHEQAHLAAAGSLALSGPNYVYQTGPDGKQYAIGGDVKIDTSKGRTPEETAQKAKQIRAAALAPAEPSAQDMKVAAAAASMEMEATAKLSEKNSKNSDKPYGQASDEDSATAEVTSARQVFAASASENENGDQPNEQQDPSHQPGYLIRAAQLYASHGA